MNRRTTIGAVPPREPDEPRHEQENAVLKQFQLEKTSALPQPRLRIAQQPLSARRVQTQLPFTALRPQEASTPRPAARPRLVVRSATAVRHKADVWVQPTPVPSRTSGRPEAQKAPETPAARLSVPAATLPAATPSFSSALQTCPASAGPTAGGPLPLRGVRALVCVYLDDGVSAQSAITQLLQRMGASILKSYSEKSCTHVVFKQGSRHLYERLRGHPRTKLVSVLWVRQCFLEQRWVDEAQFPVDRTEVSRSARARRSMAPARLPLLLNPSGGSFGGPSVDYDDALAASPSRQRSQSSAAPVPASLGAATGEVPGAWSDDESGEAAGDTQAACDISGDLARSIASALPRSPAALRRRNLSVVSSPLKARTATPDSPLLPGTRYTGGIASPRSKSPQSSPLVKAKRHAGTGDALDRQNPRDSPLIPSAGAAATPGKRRVHALESRDNSTPRKRSRNDDSPESSPQNHSASAETPLENSKRPRRKGRPISHIVLTGFATAEARALAKDVQRLGGFRIVAQVDACTTHVIVGERRRTMAVLLAVARGCWVVGPEWVGASLAGESPAWQPEQPFEAVEWFPGCRTAREAKGSPRPSERSAARPSSAGLVDYGCLSGLKIFLGDTRAPRPDLELLVQLSNGLVVDTLFQASCVVGDCDSVPPLRPHVREAWLLDSVMAQAALSFSDYSA